MTAHTEATAAAHTSQKKVESVTVYLKLLAVNQQLIFIIQCFDTIGWVLAGVAGRPMKSSSSSSL